MAGGDAYKVAKMGGHEGKWGEEGREWREKKSWVRWRRRRGEVVEAATASMVGERLEWGKLRRNRWWVWGRWGGGNVLVVYKGSFENKSSRSGHESKITNKILKIIK